MIKRLLATFLIAYLLLPVRVLADEGMWLLALIQQYNIEKMQKLGFQLSASDIYDVNNASLKDAVVALDYGSCTAEFVSADGLLFTNHHCGYDEIQSHSSVQNDYLTNGFWAKRGEELVNPGKTVSLLFRMEDVTLRALQGVSSSMEEAVRNEIIENNKAFIMDSLTAGTHYDAQVKSFYNGNQFFAFILETFKDVRLVGAPPEAIGKFGHDTDNWMYPRHTGDFSIFRVYTGPDGKPAEYSENNIPYHPKKFLKISLGGYKPGDFAMIMGYPGTTERYLTSFGVDYTMNIVNPIRIKVRTVKQDIMKAGMDSDPKIRIQYSSKYASSSNYWKYSIGQNQGLTNLNVVEKKRKIEADLTNWIQADNQRQNQYGDILSVLKQTYIESEKLQIADNYINEAIFGGADLVIFAWYNFGLFQELSAETPNEQAIAEKVTELRNRESKYFKDYHAPTDQKILAAMLKLYKENVDLSMHPGIYEEINKKFKGNIDNYVKKLFEESVLVDQEKFQKFLDKPKMKTLSEDPGFKLMMSFLDAYRGIYMLNLQAQSKSMRSERLFSKSLREMLSNQVFYPDANSTMRLTYGTVLPYEPKDGVQYKYYTSIKGIMQKEDKNNPEFVVPARLKELYQNKDFGRYGVKLDDGSTDLNVCFITNNDITGGNSGSPVMNKNGDLIGIAFDGNWEAMSGDIAYEPDLQRTISVDIRYVLFVIEKYAGAKHLIDELVIVE